MVSAWSVVDRLLMPVVLVTAGVVLVVVGERDMGFVLLAAGAGVMMPQRLTGFRAQQ